MSDTDGLTVKVNGTDIIVRMPGTTNIAIYHQPNGSPQLRFKVQVGPVDFRVHAWKLANAKAHQLGWLQGGWAKRIASLPHRNEALAKDGAQPVRKLPQKVGSRNDKK